MGDVNVDVGRWNWEHVFDRINSSIEDAGINTILNLSYSFAGSADYKDVPGGVTPTAVLDRKTVWRNFNDRNCQPVIQNTENDGKNDRYYSFLTMPEEYIFRYKLFVDGYDEYEALSKKIVENFNGGYVDFKINNLCDENAPYDLRINLIIDKPEKVLSRNQFSEIFKVPIEFSGTIIRTLKMPTEAATNEQEIGDYLGIAQGLLCINSVFRTLSGDVSSLNEIQNFKKKTFLMTKDIATLGSQYLNHQPLDRKIFEKQIVLLPYFYPNLYEELSAGKKVQIQELDDLKAKLNARYKLVYKKTKEIFALTGLPMEHYEQLDSIGVGMNRKGLSVDDAIAYAYHELQAADELVSSFGDGIRTSVKQTVGEVAKTAAGVAIGNKISGNTGGNGNSESKPSRYKDLRGSAGCAKNNKAIVACMECNLYFDCVWGEGKGKY